MPPSTFTPEEELLNRAVVVLSCASYRNQALHIFVRPALLASAIGIASSNKKRNTDTPDRAWHRKRMNTFYGHCTERWTSCRLDLFKVLVRLFLFQRRSLAVSASWETCSPMSLFSVLELQCRRGTSFLHCCSYNKKKWCCLVLRHTIFIFPSCVSCRTLRRPVTCWRRLGRCRSRSRRLW